MSSNPRESSDPGLLPGLIVPQLDFRDISETSAINKDESSGSFLQPVSCLSHELKYSVSERLSFT